MTRRFLTCSIACSAIFVVLVATSCARREPLRQPAPASSPAQTGSPAPGGSADPSASTPPDQASPPASPPAGGTPSPQPNGATLIAFAQPRTGGSSDVGGDVTEPGKLDPFLTGETSIDQRLRAAADRYRRAGTRLLAFRLNGCQESGATLAIQSGRVVATLTGGENYQCFVAEHYVALFAVPASLIPPGAKIG